MGSAAGRAAGQAGADSRRRLRLAVLLAPTGILLVVAGPAIAGLEVFPLPQALGQPLFAVVGAAAAVGAVYHADASDDLPTIADQNLRLLMLLISMVAIAIAAAWLWLGLMNLTAWILGSGSDPLM